MSRCCAQAQLAGPVASDPVVSRLVSALAADLPRALKAVRSAGVGRGERAWALAGSAAPAADGGLVTVDLNATVVIAPAWADHGETGNGEPLAIVLRPGGAGSNTAAWLALAQLSRHLRRRVLAWTQMVALAGSGRRWEPKWLRLRIFAVSGRLARSGRRLRLRLAERWPWAGEVTAPVTCLQAIPPG